MAPDSGGWRVPQEILGRHRLHPTGSTCMMRIEEVSNGEHRCCCCYRLPFHPCDKWHVDVLHAEYTIVARQGISSSISEVPSMSIQTDRSAAGADDGQAPTAVSASSPAIGAC